MEENLPQSQAPVNPVPVTPTQAPPVQPPPPKKFSIRWVSLILVLIIVLIGGLIIWDWLLPKESCTNAISYHKEEYKYAVHDNYVVVSGSIGKYTWEKTTINLSIGDEFYMPGGLEESRSVKLEKIKNKKAYFKYQYGAAPPACGTLGGCGYECRFIIEE